MPFQSYLCYEHDFIHERQQFYLLTEMLEKAYREKDDYALLIGNYNADGKELDALFIKDNAIVVIEFKDYGGNKLTCCENGSWMLDDRLVMGGTRGKNPLQQVKQNRFGLMQSLSRFSNWPNVNYAHISGMVLFNKRVEEINRDQLSISEEKWFFVDDIDNALKTLIYDVGSSGICLSHREFSELPLLLNISGKEFSTSDFKANVVETHTVEENLENSIGSLLVEAVAKSDTDLQILEQPKKLSITKDILRILENPANKFNIRYHKQLPEKPARYKSVSDLRCSSTVAKLLQPYGGKLYEHQHEAFKRAMQGSNVCITTSTGSGKSLVFYLSAIELLSRDPAARIMAVYPTKALGMQQELNWQKAIKESGLKVKVGRIDGQVSVDERKGILAESSIVICTPDVIHAWMLNQRNDRQAWTYKNEYMRQLKLIIIDEAHSFGGVFGSNSAYLLRRLNLFVEMLGSDKPQYIAASATIDEPDEFLKELTGMDFEIVDNTYDSSPKQKIDLIMVEPDEFSNLFEKSIKLLREVYNSTAYQFIKFVDSRKMAEQLSAAVNRNINNTVSDAEDDDDESYSGMNNHIDEITNELKGVLPFKSGFEKEVSEQIVNGLINQKIRGVISTSALELGIDIGSLDIGFLWGIPNSSTSLYQRIGRIGRKNEGVVVIINDGSILSSSVFNNPPSILSLPVTVNTLYLDNPMMQFIHAYCLYHEHSADNEDINNERLSLKIAESFPEEFYKKWVNIRDEQDNRNYYKNMVSQMINTEPPHFVFPLRDIEPNFRIYRNSLRERHGLGSISFSQMMREAYPGAVYYHAGTPYRVNKVTNTANQKTIEVSNERRFVFTNPIKPPAYRVPDFLTILTARRYNELRIIESAVSVNEMITGYKEKRNSQNNDYLYPNAYHKKKFFRSIETTGIVIYHPVFQNSALNLNHLAKILYEVFLIKLPYDRQDIDFGVNRINFDNPYVPMESSFITIYDSTYGSLRLTQKLTDAGIMRKVFEKAKEALMNDDSIYMELLEDSEKFNKALMIETLDKLNAELDNYADDIEHFEGYAFRKKVFCNTALYGNIQCRIIHASYDPDDKMVKYYISYTDNTGIRPMVRTVSINEYEDISPLDNQEYCYLNIETGETEEIESFETNSPNR